MNTKTQVDVHNPDRKLYHQLINIEQQKDVRSVLDTAQNFLERHLEVCFSESLINVLNTLQIARAEPRPNYTPEALDEIISSGSKQVRDDYEKYLAVDPEPR